MKLSEAVELGGMLVKPNRTKLLSADGEEACGIGMALLAVGEPAEIIRSLGYFRLCEIWPWVDRFGYDRIYETFDDMHRVANWKGEEFHLSEFVNWLRSVEPADLPKPAPAPPAEQEMVTTLETVPGPQSQI